VLLRLKEDYDGAEPSASSIATQNLLTIAHLTGDTGALAKAERTLARYGPRIGSAARVVPMMLTSLSAWHAGLSQVVVAGDSRDSLRDLLAAIGALYLPFAIVLPVTGGPSQEALARMLPFVAGMKPVDGRGAAYVCRNFTCRQPVTTVEDLKRELVQP
jgi:uncharacterized protein YyaL (SSP411 family)